MAQNPQQAGSEPHEAGADEDRQDVVGQQLVWPSPLSSGLGPPQGNSPLLPLGQDLAQIEKLKQPKANPT